MENATPQESVRVGSPFAVDPPPVRVVVAKEALPPEQIYDVGPMRYTAMGAVAAAVMLIGFAVAAAVWFPGGGTMIAAWGCVLSILGLYSPMSRRSAGCLIVHTALFLICYARSLGN